jgi:hypothetical protein
MIDIISAIKKINPKAEVSINADDINQITWHNGTTPIPTNEILAKQQELIAEYNAKQYQRDRANEYPSIVDQLDDIFHNGIDSWKLKIQTIKDKYPKV